MTTIAGCLGSAARYHATNFLRPRHSIDEPDEQRRATFGGVWGEKGAGQGEHRSVPHSPDTERGTSVPRIERCASSSSSRQPSKVGAECGNAARTVLCGGRSAMIVPTATTGGLKSEFVVRVPSACVRSYLLKSDASSIAGESHAQVRMNEFRLDDSSQYAV